MTQAGREGTRERRHAAMEPAREERDDAGRGLGGGLAGVAAMEPAREERDDSSAGCKPYLWRRLPQWSPLVKSGMTGGGVRQPDGPRAAAMEPAREEAG